MGLKNARLISSFVLLALITGRIFFGPLVPDDLSIVTEEKIYLLEAGEPWGLYFKHPLMKHPYLDKDSVATLRLEDDFKGIELTIEHIKSDTQMGAFGLSFLSLSHPFSSIQTPLHFEKPRLMFLMVDGSSLSFQLPWVSFYPESEQRSILTYHELYGLYQDDTAGLQGVYIRIHNPTHQTLCLDGISLGMNASIPFEHVYLTREDFTPHQRLHAYQKSPFHGCFEPYQEARLLVDHPLDVVLEHVRIHLKMNHHPDLYVNPIRLVRNIPFHHEIDRIKGVFDD